MDTSCSLLAMQLSVTHALPIVPLAAPQAKLAVHAPLDTTSTYKFVNDFA
jgi:hypothetical protein